MLVLSLFPGIGLLDMAFEEEGFCVVRGPDLLRGGDIHRFHPPAGKFDGIIGGPPCQAHSRLAHLNRALGRKIAPDLLPEFARVIGEAAPAWWLAENVPDVPSIEVPGWQVHRLELDNRWLGEKQSRRRAWQFGTRDGRKLCPEVAVFDSPEREPACLATESKGCAKFKSGRVIRHARRPFKKFLELQGLPEDFLAAAPFTLEAKYRVVGNGVPLAMGRAVARAVKRALEKP